MKNIDSIGHVRGESVYLDDITELKGTLHGVIFDSPAAHGKITGIDYAEAANLAGVIKIITCKDIPGQNQIGGIIPDEPLLAENEVHFCGQPIAIIIAESQKIAAKARKLISVTIEEDVAIVEPREAKAQNKLIIPPRTLKLVYTKGTWRDCEYIFEGTAKLAFLRLAMTAPVSAVHDCPFLRQALSKAGICVAWPQAIGRNAKNDQRNGNERPSNNDTFPTTTLRREALRVNRGCSAARFTALRAPTLHWFPKRETVLKGCGTGLKMSYPETISLR